MGSDRFVIPTTKKIDISDDDWILIKAELDTGDQRKQDCLALVPTMIDGNVVDRVDWSIYEILRAKLWLLDWSLMKPNGDGKMVSVPVSLQAIKELKPETFEEINTAIFNHIMTWAREKKAKRNQKNSQNQESNSEVT